MISLFASLFVSSAIAAPNPLFNLFHRDSDDDGIQNKDDECPRYAETVNGYADEDGCPDSLTHLTISAYFQGRPRPDASLHITIGDQTFDSTGSFTITDQIPGQVVYVTSVMGCLNSEATFVLEPDPQRIRLNLYPATEEVNVRVLGSSGQPVRSDLRWESYDPSPCRPSGSTRLQEGVGVFTLGYGDHTVQVRSKDARGEFTLHVTPQTHSIDIPLHTAASTGTKLPEIIHFNSGSARLDAAAHQIIQAVNERLSTTPGLSLIVEGHADERASEAYNLDLSRRRAEAVIAALITLGVSTDRLKVSALGEDAPLERGYSTSSLAANRRVQFIPIN